MTKPAAKKSDQIVSVTPGDVHIIMIPSPGGPVPTPIPHPCASMIKDKVAKKVKVMGQPGATKGSKSKHTPPHIPQGGPFQKPPGNKGEVMTGSSSVKYQGKDATMLGETGKMCSDPSDTPVGKVIGTAAMVLVGGGSASGDADRAKASADAMKAASAHCHKWINDNMPEGADREQAHRDVCTATGHPVDVATGKMFTRNVDVRLPGRIPVELVRNYSTARNEEPGPFGCGWRHNFQIDLFEHADFVAHRDANGRYLPFEAIGVGAVSRSEVGSLTLSRPNEDVYRVTDASGLSQVFRASGRKISGARVFVLSALEDRFGNRVQLAHDEQGHLIRIVDTAGRRLLLSWDERDRVQKLSLAPDETSTPTIVREYGYSDAGDLVEWRDRLGHSYRFEYVRHLMVRETDRCGFSFYFTYDELGWCRETWGEGGLFYRRLEYDRVRGQSRVVDSLGGVTSHLFDERGVVVEQVDPAGTRSSFDYDEALHPVRAEDALGNLWTYEWDDRGNLIGTEDPLGNTTKWAYDERGRGIEHADAAGCTRTWEYADDVRAVRRTDVDGKQTLQQQDELGQLAVVFHPDGGTDRLEYDSRGNVARILTATGNVIERRYDSWGGLIEETDSQGRRLEIDYDERRSISRIWKRDGGERRVRRDPEGRPTRIEESGGRVTEIEYGHFDRILVQRQIGTDAAGARIISERRNEYDTENRLIGVSLSGGRSFRYHYEGSTTAPTRIERPDGCVIRVERDALGHIVRLFENDELVYEQETNYAGQVVRRVTASGEVFEFEYDELMRRVRATNASGTTESEFDSLGRLRGESSVHGSLERYFEVEDPSVLRGYRVEGGAELVLTAGEAARQQWQLVGSSLEIDLDFDSLGRLRSIESGPVDQVFEYGDESRPRWRRVRHAGREELTEYVYDEASLLERIDRQGETVEIRRDPLGRLAEVERRQGDRVVASRRWEYDSADDRAFVRDESGEHGLKHLPGNRLSRRDEDRFEWDGRGRLLSRVDSQGRRTSYEWSDLGQLRAVVTRDGVRIEYEYDALGRRITRRCGEDVTRYVWSSRQLVEERRGDRIRHFLYREDGLQPMALIEREGDGEWRGFTYLNDARGCPEAVFDQEGRYVWKGEIGPFGDVESEDSDAGFDQPWLLIGQWRGSDPDEPVYNHARWYDPSTASYLSADPLGLQASENLYSYPQDPFSAFDPLGLSSDDYSPPDPRVVACGEPQDAWLVRPGELDWNGTAYAAMPGHPMQLDLNESDRYLYVVSESGAIYYAPQTPQGVPFEVVKHTSLAGRDPADPRFAAPSRVSGEINYDHDRKVWVMDGASGRYSSDGRGNVTRTPDNVAAASDLNQSFGPGGTPIEPSPNVFPG
ncbi:MAG: DUF6531 domain-containing protein [Planctomycetota bacterium]